MTITNKLEELITKQQNISQAEAALRHGQGHEKHWMCHIVGHKFGGYEIPRDANGNKLQQMPSYFWCARCKSLRSTTEGWA